MIDSVQKLGGTARNITVYPQIADLPYAAQEAINILRGNIQLSGNGINEGSKFEHSNISTIKRYRKKAIREYSQDQIFVFDLGKSNVNIWFTVFKYSLMSMYWAFESISNRIQGREKQLLEEKPYGKSAYSEKDFTEIDMKFKKCMALVEREPKYQVVMKFKNENSDSNDVSEIQSKESKTMKAEPDNIDRKAANTALRKI